MTKKEILKETFVSSIPVLSGYLLLGIGFGVLLKDIGYGAFWAFIMALLIFAGSMQYAMIPLMAGGASLLTVAVTTLLVNLRHLFYGISMAGKYSEAGAKKPYLMLALTDETYSLVCSGHEDMSKEDFHTYAFFLSLMNHSYWIAGCVIGGLIGNILPFDTKGIDFVLTALFISVFTQQWMDNKDKRPAITGLASAALCLVIFGKDDFLIPAMVLIALVLSFLKPKEEAKTDQDPEDGLVKNEKEAKP